MTDSELIEKVAEMRVLQKRFFRTIPAGKATDFPQEAISLLWCV